MRKLIVAFMASVLAFSATGAAAFADSMIARADKDNWIAIDDRPCAYGALRTFIKPEWYEKFRAARAILDGQPWQACWYAENGQVLVLFEDGESVVLPITAFKPEGI